MASPAGRDPAGHGPARGQLTAQSAELESQRNTLAAERDGLEIPAERTGRRTAAMAGPARRRLSGTATRSANNFTTRLAELESQRIALAAERDGLEIQRNALAKEHRQWQAQQEDLAETQTNTTDKWPPDRPSLNRSGMRGRGTPTMAGPTGRNAPGPRRAAGTACGRIGRARIAAKCPGGGTGEPGIPAECPC